MRLAIKEARKNLLTLEGGPFGACIVKGGRVIAVGRNAVLVSDATSHAEVNAIRIASKRLKDFDLSGCVIYSTTEPCPMCFSAIHWARLDTVIYGTTIADAKKLGFNELGISARKMRAVGRSRVKIVSGFERRSCLRLMKDWDKSEGKRIY
jgi:tRNA(Arg) A34 adenosine deaminase TadA